MLCPNRPLLVLAAACLTRAACALSPVLDHTSDRRNVKLQNSVAAPGSNTGQSNIDWLRGATTGTALAPATDDCVCASSWKHETSECVTGRSPALLGRLGGCPSLEALADCEVEPQVSWCMTTAATCNQQQGDAVGQSWVLCDAETQKPELPHCTCANAWENDEGDCAQSGDVYNGCPTVEQLRKCNSNYTGTSWCVTNEAECQEQEDWPWEGGEAQVGQGWAYCDAEDQRTELPVCECEARWSPDQADCDDGVNASALSFSTCPTHEELMKCQGHRKSTDQSYCATKQDRCRQQSDGPETYFISGPEKSNGSERTMVGEGWSYCTPPASGKRAAAVLPKCECKWAWYHQEDSCAIDQAEFNGCPTVDSLHRCEASPTQSWCVTTYAACMEQYGESVCTF